jgi:hypothetical protein
LFDSLRQETALEIGLCQSMTFSMVSGSVVRPSGGECQVLAYGQLAIDKKRPRVRLNDSLDQAISELIRREHGEGPG